MQSVAMQARMQEMKWGVLFVKKWKIGGVFCKKSGKWWVFFCKKVENNRGCFFVKSGPFLNAGCIMYSISIVYFTFCLFGGAYAPNAPPLPTGLWCTVSLCVCVSVGHNCELC